MNPIDHVAIIMDGNGRWGLKFKGSRNAGHKVGLKNCRENNKRINQTKKYNFLHCMHFLLKIGKDLRKK